MLPTSPFDRWLDELAERFTRELRFSELRKGVTALSRVYVEERRRLGGSAIFGGAAKRAAFACFYAPLHFLLVQEILRELAPKLGPKRILDLGCGTAAAGAAWALFHEAAPFVLGVDRSPWAASEAGFTLRALGLEGKIRVGDLERAPTARAGDAVIAAFAVNELAPELRAALLERLVAAVRKGAAVLIVEPIARKPSPWWPEWRRAFESLSGRADEWRFSCELPPFLAELDRASGLDHRELTGKSLSAGLGAPGRSKRGQTARRNKNGFDRSDLSDPF